ncbi:MAG TPA: DUF1326 domain-containing protein [Actinomycetota bacterium]|nr:DUF1326 domain-containing protein [Actinomycetota bacterium]
MAWHIEGTYFENCNCDMVCPCSTSGLTAPGDQDRCKVVLVFHIDSGEVEGVDVSGLTVGMAADAPGLMSQGNWRVGLFMDAAASQDQAAALGAVFGGQKGGALAALAPLIGENLGMETLPIEYRDNGARHSVKIGDIVDMEVEDFTSPLSGSGKPVQVSGVGFPADTLTAGTATKSKMNAFGLTFSNEGKNSFSAPFAWSA